jgi:hypothetical protein
MRNFGGIVLILGVLGFFYASAQLEKAAPLAPNQTIAESLESAAGRWEMARYACAGVAFVGLLLAMFPKGR